MLISVLVTAKAFKSQVTAGSGVRLDGSGAEERRSHGKGSAGPPMLSLRVMAPGHFDGSAEGDLAVALHEVLIHLCLSQ